jgi:hypothetical protein
MPVHLAEGTSWLPTARFVETIRPTVIAGLAQQETQSPRSGLRAGKWAPPQRPRMRLALPPQIAAIWLSSSFEERTWPTGS